MTITVPPAEAQPDPPKSNGYALVPRSVLTDSRLSDRAVRLYALLDARTTGRSTFVRVEVLAADLGVSPRTIDRSLAELTALGYVVRTRTRGVAMTAVANPVRARRVDTADASSTPRYDKPVVPDTTDLSDTSRNNSPRNNYKIKGRRPAQRPYAPGDSRDPVPATAAAASLDAATAYVEAIAQATGVPLKPTNAAKALVLKIAARGLTPAQAGQAAQERLVVAQALRVIYDPPAFLAKTVLTDLAEGAPVPVEAATRPTPIPPPVAEVLPRQTLDLDARADAAERGLAACRAALRQELDAVAPDTFEDWLAQEAAHKAASASTRTA